MRVHRTDAELLDAIKSVDCARRGEMPSSRDLRAAGMNAIACLISRRGGFEQWAERAGLRLRDSCTKRGRAAELNSADWLAGLGFSVEKQTRKAPFDLLVDGRVRVNVKSGKHGSFEMPGGGKCEGHFFGIGKTWKHCDVFLLCAVADDGVVLSRHIVPSRYAQVATITLTPDGKYKEFRDAVHLIREAMKGS